MINRYTKNVFDRIKKTDIYNKYAGDGGTIITTLSFLTLMGSIKADNMTAGSAALLLMLGEYPYGDASILKPVNYHVGKGAAKLKKYFSDYF